MLKHDRESSLSAGWLDWSEGGGEMRRSEMLPKSLRAFGAANWITSIAAIGACIAAGAALWQASISRDTEFRQLRAYLYVSHGQLNQTANSAGAEISVKHSGATPAYNIKIDAVALVGKYLLNDEELGDPTQMGGATQKRISILNGADQFVSASLSLTKQQRQAVWRTRPLRSRRGEVP
jgi:hypothetical protein